MSVSCTLDHKISWGLVACISDLWCKPNGRYFAYSAALNGAGPHQFKLKHIDNYLTVCVSYILVYLPSLLSWPQFIIFSAVFGLENIVSFLIRVDACHVPSFGSDAHWHISLQDNQTTPLLCISNITWWCNQTAHFPPPCPFTDLLNLCFTQSNWLCWVIRQ